MKIKSTLLEANRVSRNGRLYSRECLEAYLEASKEQQESNSVPIVVHAYDEYGNLIEPINENTTIVGAGSLKLDGDSLVVEGIISDDLAKEISQKYAVSVCLADTESSDGVEVVKDITLASLCVNIGDSSAFFDKPNIKVIK